jgi:hypothetical protein
MIIYLPFGIRIMVWEKPLVLTLGDLSRIDLTGAKQVPDKVVDQINQSREKKRDTLLKSLKEPL